MNNEEFIFPIRVYVEDTDCGGIVYHANFLKYFERARSEWADHRGQGLEWQRERGIHFVVCYANLKYIKPAFLHQKLEVVSRIKEKRPASLVYDQHLRLADVKDTILCKAEIKIACVDKDLRPTLLDVRLSS